MKPKSLEDLSVALNSIPGITKKQSEKIAFALLTQYKDEGKTLVDTFNKSVKNIKTCKECGNIGDSEKCLICQDIEKDRRNILVVVESPLDVFKFEQSGSIKPYYHVLNGLIDVTNRKDIEDLNIKKLPSRAKRFNEVILALSPNIEGIVTANYIKSLLSNSKVTQLAQGIPLGAAMEYVDELTLKTAIKNRKDVK